MQICLFIIIGGVLDENIKPDWLFNSYPNRSYPNRSKRNGDRWVRLHHRIVVRWSMMGRSVVFS